MGPPAPASIRPSFQLGSLFQFSEEPSFHLEQKWRWSTKGLHRHPYSSMEGQASQRRDSETPDGSGQRGKHCPNMRAKLLILRCLGAHQKARPQWSFQLGRSQPSCPKRRTGHDRSRPYLVHVRSPILKVRAHLRQGLFWIPSGGELLRLGTIARVVQ